METDVLERFWELHGEHEVAMIGATSGTTPAAYTVPGSVQVDVLSVSFLYTASSDAGTRTVRLEFLDGAGNVFAAAASPFTMVASDATTFTFGVGMQQFGANSAKYIGTGIPPIRLCDGYGFRVRCVNSAAADTIGPTFLNGRWHRVRLDL